MVSGLSDFYLQKEEPVKSCLMAMREVILKYDKSITESWKYKMPFFCYQGKMFCYLWVHKKTRMPYLGVVEGRKINHPALQQEKRLRMKIMLIDPKEDLPVKAIYEILTLARTFYREIK
jgi:Domain of unknown function (DU1801)